MNPYTALVVVAALAVYVILTLTGHPVPVWLAAIGTVFAGAFPALFQSVTGIKPSGGASSKPEDPPAA